VVAGTLGAGAPEPTPERARDGRGGCGGVEIVATAARFEHAFEVAFTIDPPESDICGPHGKYAATVFDARMVELRPADEASPARLPLAKPLRFQPLRARGGTGPIDLTAASTLENATAARVPAGRYRLVLRYVPAPCSGRVFERTCVARSEPFVLTSPIHYAVTSHELDVGPWGKSNRRANGATD